MELSTWIIELALLVWVAWGWLLWGIWKSGKVIEHVEPPTRLQKEEVKAVIVDIVERMKK